MSAKHDFDLFALDQKLLCAMQLLCQEQSSIDRARASVASEFGLFFLNITTVQVELGLAPQSELDKLIEELCESTPLSAETLTAYVHFKRTLFQYARVSESLADGLWGTGIR